MSKFSAIFDVVVQRRARRRLTGRCADGYSTGFVDEARVNFVDEAHVGFVDEVRVKFDDEMHVGFVDQARVGFVDEARVKFVARVRVEGSRTSYARMTYGQLARCA